MTEPRKMTAIRLRPSVVHQARIAAVTEYKTMGQWLEEAIQEKLERAETAQKEAKRGRHTS